MLHILNIAQRPQLPSGPLTRLERASSHLSEGKPLIHRGRAQPHVSLPLSHPEPLLNLEGSAGSIPVPKLQMNTTMLAVFLASLAGFTGVYYWMWTLRVRAGTVELRRATEGEDRD